MKKFFTYLGNKFVWDNNGRECSGEEIQHGIDKGSRNGVLFLFGGSLVFGLLYGVLLLAKQFSFYLDPVSHLPISRYDVPDGLFWAYVTCAGAFTAVNQADLWSTTRKLFRKGEYIILFWFAVIFISAVVHFFSAGFYQYPSDDLKMVMINVLAFYAVSRGFSSARKVVLEKKNGNGNQQGESPK